MQTWEIYSYSASLYAGSLLGPVSSSRVWTGKDKTGKTQWDYLTEIASQGWELVSVTPINNKDGSTFELLFTFKRPIEQP